MSKFIIENESYRLHTVNTSLITGVTTLLGIATRNTFCIFTFDINYNSLVTIPLGKWAFLRIFIEFVYNLVE